MVRTRVPFLVLATLLTVVPRAAEGQDPGVLHIEVLLIDSDRKPMPVPRHPLLISDNPATSEPRRVVTRADGTADVRLPPGNYTVESDAPVAYSGKTYSWTQIVDVVAGRNAVLRLTADNAEIASAGSASTPTAPLEADDSLAITKWQSSVVTLWTPTTRASGFLVDTNGVLVTSQRVVAAATRVEVQVTPALKVAGSVIVTDSARDVAVLRVDPAAVASVPHVPLVCAPSEQPRVVSGEKLFTIDAPLHQPRATLTATASSVAAHAIESDFYLSTGSVGAPVFTKDGLVGVTSVHDDAEANRRGNVRIVRIDDVCSVVASAREKAKGAAAPGASPLPVEPERPFPIDALKEMVARRAGSLNPYQAASASFDVFFITPVQTYGAEYQAEERSRRQRGTSTRPTVVVSAAPGALTDFGNWTEYVAEYPPVLLVRLTPKLVEGFWTKVARGAAQTQGMAIPPIKRFTSGFSHMRAYCGDSEVTPIHPFTIERRVSETDTIEEGLYVFDPGALAPSCSTVKLVLFSEKNPAKPETLTVDPTVIQRIWEDFGPYRALK